VAISAVYVTYNRHSVNFECSRCVSVHKPWQSKFYSRFKINTTPSLSGFLRHYAFLTSSKLLTSDNLWQTPHSLTSILLERDGIRNSRADAVPSNLNEPKKIPPKFPEIFLVGVQIYEVERTRDVLFN